METRFPGVNPYLEDAYFWHRFHTALIVHLSDRLNTMLPAGYIAAGEQRLAILPDNQPRIADVALIRTRITPERDGKSSVALVERGMPHGTVSALSNDVYERFIEIRTARKPRRVVTLIEVLSPSNKAPGSQGRREYLQKQREILHSDTHLLEIDLLRFGAHTVAVPMENLPSRETWDFIISLHRADNRFRYDYWLSSLTEPLPNIRVPLLSGDDDLVLDLQSAYQEVFLAGRYADEIEYSDPIPDRATYAAL